MDSQAIINTMEVLETKPITDLVSESVIKVCYVSDKANPNQTVINYEVGKQIAATLPGAPVVGFFDKTTGDFEQHSRRITISDGEINIEDITKPYGFVSPMHQPWYQDFNEDGEIRTYLMCRAYLWTRQYEEAKQAFGKGQSMELDEHSMSGYYEGDVFVFTSATLDKLCILGDDYPPCFSGAKIMTTYAKEYNNLAANIENTIGRRYYIMNNQMITDKPEVTEASEIVTLEYALGLGWNLNEAIYMQLNARGFECKYDVEGVYTENGVIFTILRDRETLEYLRCDITITADEKVEMSTEFTSVSPTFVPKTSSEDKGVPALGGNEVNAPDASATSEAATEESADPEIVTPPAEIGEFKKKDDEDEDKSASDNSDDSSNSDDSDDSSKDSGSESGASQDDDGSANDKDDEDDEDKNKKKKPATKNSLEENGTDESEVPEMPAIDFAARIAELETQLSEANASISALTEELNIYKEKDAKLIKEQKEELIASYTEILSDEDLKDVQDHFAEYSLDDIESKLAVTYTRKMREAKAQSEHEEMQVNVGSFAAQTPNLPSYLQEALEYDQAHRLNMKF